MTKRAFKIGVVTLFGLFNYGNRLQAYAVQRVLAGLGYRVEMIVSTDLPMTRRVKNAAKRALGRPVKTEDLLSPGRFAAFSQFNERIATRTTRLRDIHPAEYTCFVAGSDQVWNPAFIGYRHPEMLPFAPPEKRVALAASFGVSEIPSKDRDWFAREVSGFAHISVREERAVEIVRELTGRTAELILDPTLMLTSQEWFDVANDRLTPKGEYVFSYLLGGVSEDARFALSEVRHGNLPVVELSDRERRGEPPAGPAEFVSLVSHASHVVTDSFHASAFALLMGTPLTIVRRQSFATADDMFSRMESLAHMLALEKNVFRPGALNLTVAGDYARSYELLDIERSKFNSFLERSLPRSIRASGINGNHTE